MRRALHSLAPQKELAPPSSPGWRGFSVLPSADRFAAAREGVAGRPDVTDHHGLDRRFGNVLNGGPAHQKIRSGSASDIIGWNEDFDRAEGPQRNRLLDVTLDQISRGVEIVDAVKHQRI